MEFEDLIGKTVCVGCIGQTGFAWKVEGKVAAADSNRAMIEVTKDDGKAAYISYSSLDVIEEI